MKFFYFFDLYVASGNRDTQSLTNIYNVLYQPFTHLPIRPDQAAITTNVSFEK